MNEIEKMYENVGIEPEYQDCCKIADKYWANNTESGFEYLMQKECPYNQECTDECEYAYDKVVYPPFTAEKQLKLIKWLVQKYKDISIEHKLNLFYINIIDIYTGMVHIEFDETIAGLINNLWQFLTEEERKQIREILK